MAPRGTIQTEIGAPFKRQVKKVDKVIKSKARSSSPARVFCGGHGLSD